MRPHRIVNLLLKAPACQSDCLVLRLFHCYFVPMKPLFPYLLVLSLVIVLPGRPCAQSAIQWEEFPEAIQRAQLENKKILIEVYTQWCGWCKVMDQKTFHHPEVVDYINDRYVAVRFDAEDQSDIQFKGNTYSFVKKGRNGYHELAAELMRGRLSYPTIVFLDEQLNVIQPIPGYQNPQDFQMILMYFADNYFRRVPWGRFTEQYKNRFLGQPVNRNNR